MKVLLVAHVGYPWGGVSQRYSDLLESSLKKKIDLTFFESSPNKGSFSKTGSFSIENIYGFLRVNINFIRVVMKVRPSIVHIASANGLSFVKHSFIILISKLLRTKVILAPHCSITVFIPKSRIKYLWMKFVLNQCDGIIVLSHEWMPIQKLIPRTRVILLKNAINLSKYLALDRHGAENHHDVQIIYLGHVGEEKGINDLVWAVKRLDEKGIHGFRVNIFGEDLHPGELSAAKDLSKRLAIDEVISFLTPVFNNEKLEIFQRADIFIFPSHHEGLPISIIEAMASGLPVIATTVGGIPDLIDNSQNGILVNAKSPTALSTAMQTLIDDSQLRRVYGLNGRNKVIDNHDIEQYVEKLVSYYIKLDK
jgi:glycosyltransferase involved in cell wall biosynthesis